MRVLLWRQVAVGLGQAQLRLGLVQLRRGLVAVAGQVDDLVLLSSATRVAQRERALGERALALDLLVERGDLLGEVGAARRSAGDVARQQGMLELALDLGQLSGSRQTLLGRESLASCDWVRSACAT